MENKNTNNEIALKVSHFYKSYSRKSGFAVSDVSFDVKAGEFHGFIGANGAGKTTTIKSIIGAYAKFNGKISIFGFAHDKVEAKKRIGYIPETAQFPKELTAYEYIKLMAHLDGMKLKAAAKFSKDTLTELGFGKTMKKKANDFSSGQKKKILLAQALIRDPDLIIMDEPAANLDPKARSDFFRSLKELQKKGKAILISSHILAELDEFVDSLTIIDLGKLIYSGTKEEVTRTDKFDYIFAFDDPKDDKKVRKFFKQEKLKIENTEELSIVKIKNEKNFFKTIGFFKTQKLIPSTFSRNQYTLQEVYERFVVKGLPVKGYNNV